MTPEPEQNAPVATGTARAETAAPKPRAGVPIWRTGKPDAVLAAAVDVARTAVEGIAPAGQIGRHLGAKSEGDRLVTHLFESELAGYGGWRWYAVLTRNSRSKNVTVDELGLLPSEDAILAPEWVPWAERVRPGDEQGDETGAAGAEAREDRGSAEPAAYDASAGADPAEDDSAADGTTPEDDSDDADGNADGADDEYDADDVDETDEDDASNEDASGEAASDEPD